MVRIEASTGTSVQGMVRFLFFGSKRLLEPPYLTPSRGSLDREWFGFCSSDRSVYWNLRTSPQVGSPLTGSGSVFVLRIEASTGTSVPHSSCGSLGREWFGFVLRIEASTGTSVPHSKSGLPWQGMVRLCSSDRSVYWNTSPQVGAPLAGNGSALFFGSKRLLEPPYLTPSRGFLGGEWFGFVLRIEASPGTSVPDPKSGLP